MGTSDEYAERLRKIKEEMNCAQSKPSNPEATVMEEELERQKSIQKKLEELGEEIKATVPKG